MPDTLHHVVKKTHAPFGSWASPITSQDLVSQAVRLGEPHLDGDDIYWVEGRPQEKGRGALLKRSNGITNEVLPSHCNVRSRAHEYGGASYTIAQGIVFFVEAGDQRIYRFDPANDQAPIALSPSGAFRYADLCIDSHNDRIICVREDHRAKEQANQEQPPVEETNELVCLAATAPSEPQVLVSGCDFYANPELSPCGKQLSWLSWDHPAMPWDSSQCWLADLSLAGQVADARCIAGASGQESIFQPQWSPDGELYLVSDRNNWWNLYRVHITRDKLGAYQTSELTPLLELDAEFATPQWVFGMSCYGFLSADEILACYTREGHWQLARIDTHSGAKTDLGHDYRDISNIHCQHGKALLLAASATDFPSLFCYQQASKPLQLIARSAEHQLSHDSISLAQAMSFASTHGFYYPPTHATLEGMAATAPPLIVLGHGGPTGATETGLNFKIQYWTSRGFAVMDVNYRGSTGYGREYRQQLQKSWGIKDVDDVCAAAEHLIEQGLADPDRVAIKGSSAGGYTVLAALTFRDTFKAGTSLYGIGDLETLARDTHKFEARYLDSLVGDYPAQQNLYQARSPINHTEQLNCPVIFFQGLEDKVVPPAQAETMVEALDNKKVPVAYVPFPGEGHGFRQAPAITRALDAELSFYAQVFNFPLSQQDQIIEPVPVRNLTARADR